MLKCVICDKDLTTGVASAKKENGDYYLMCPSCGNVHYIKVLPNGLTEVQRTSNEDTAETRAAMKEAAELFKKAGVGIMEFKVGVHSEKTSAKELDKKTLTDEEMKRLRDSYKRIPSFIREDVSFEKYKEDFIEFKEKMEELLNDSMDELESIFGDDEDDEDCENCDNENCPFNPNHEEDPCEGCCGCDECDEEDEEEPNVEEVFRDSLPVYVAEGIDEEGRGVIATADTKEELAEVLANAEDTNVTLTRIRKVNVTLTDVKFDKKTTVNYKIND